MIRVETKAGHGANKPTSKMVTLLCLSVSSIRSIIKMAWFFTQIDEHSEVMAFLARALNLE